MKVSIFGPADRDRVEIIEAGLDELDIRYDEFTLAEPARVTCDFKRDGSIQRIGCGVDARLEIPCARCLEPVAFTAKGSFALVVKRMPFGEPLPQDSVDGEDTEGDELIHVAHDVEEFDLAERVRDAIILAVPMKVLCSDGCRGLCPSCGKNLNAGPCGCGKSGADPRWNSLSGLLNDEQRNR